MAHRAASGAGVLAISSLKGGRNGFDPPTLVPDDQCLEALNVDWYQGALGRKRPGSDSVALGGGTAFGTIGALFRHLPAGSDETAAELWAVDANSNIHRLAGGTTWADVTPKDALSGTPSLTRGRVFNGKLMLAYANGGARIQVWDGTTLRRLGLAAPTAIPTATTAGGAATDTRTYKASVEVQVSGIVQRTSELSGASNTVTLSASQATVTLNGAPNEGETHWKLWGASTDGVYHLIGTTTIGSTQVDNNATLTGNLPPSVGTNSVPPDAVLMAVEGSRLLFARHRTSTGQTSRIWWTPPFQFPGDDERVPTLLTQNNYEDINPNDGDFVTAINGPMQGAMFAWKRHQFWKLQPTGDVTAPYQTIQISASVGCLDDRGVVLATDEYGLPCLYWWSLEGPHRYGSQGLQYCGRDVEDLWPTVNLTATTPVHAVFHRTLHQIWWWIATGTNDDPNVMVVFDTILGHAQYYSVGDTPPTAGVRRGWAKWTGDLATARCSCLFARSIGTTMGLAQVPYTGFTGATVKLLRGDSTTNNTDDTTTYQALLSTKHYPFAGKGSFGDVHPPLLLAKASQGAVIQVTPVPDWGLGTAIPGQAVLTAQEAETRVWRRLEAFSVGHARHMQLLIGDPVGSTTAWTLDDLLVPVQVGEPSVG